MSKQREEIAGTYVAEIGGRTCALKLTMDGLAAFYDHAGEQQTGVKSLRALLWACLLHESPQLTLREVGALVDLRDLPAVSDALRICLSRCMPARAAQQGDGKPVDWWRLWSFGTFDLRLSDEQFWGATPRQFCALSDRHREAYERELTGHAITCSVLANIHRDSQKRSEPFTPKDFLPDFESVAMTETEKKLANVKRLQAKMAGLGAILGARRLPSAD